VEGALQVVLGEAVHNRIEANGCGFGAKAERVKLGEAVAVDLVGADKHLEVDSVAGTLGALGLSIGRGLGFGRCFGLGGGGTLGGGVSLGDLRRFVALFEEAEEGGPAWVHGVDFDVLRRRGVNEIVG